MRILTSLAIFALLSTPVLAADLGTYRPGTPYNSSLAPGADVCESHCSGDAQCRAWNYVKPNPRVSGVCEFLSSASTPIASQISISGEGYAGIGLSSRVTAGSTNTVRVGTQVQPMSNPVRVGQPAPTRRIVREPVPQRAQTQTASTRRPEHLSLTEQQNLYRGQAVQPSRPPVQPRQTVPQRPAFRPILDGASQPQRQPNYAPQPYQQTRAVPQPRRATGPRRGVPKNQYQPQPGQQPQPSTNRPPIGQPIPAPTQMDRRSVVEAQSAPVMTRPTNPVAIAPDQARRSLFGRLNDDLRAQDPAAVPTDMPIATAVPTVPVTVQPMPALAGGR